MGKYLVFLILVIALGIFLWQEIYLPKSASSEELKILSVEKNQNLFQIAKNLEKAGIIKSKYFFELYVFLKRNQGKLKAGKYSLSPGLSIAQIAKKIISGKTLKIKLTIPEGFSLKQIKTKFNTNLKRSDSWKFLAKDFKEEFDFLQTVPDSSTLEGFLFPDTYYLSFEFADRDIIRKFLLNFDKKFTANLRKAVKQQRKTIFEIVTMASLIEKEVKVKEDKKVVSGILWKRLKASLPLQVDATITYITGKKTTQISRQETQIPSAYNTYKYRGLPPGPICNPGLESILAAIYPKKTPYWYYLSTPEGKTIFSKSLQEHNLAKAKYLNTFSKTSQALSLPNIVLSSQHPKQGDILIIKIKTQLKPDKVKGKIWGKKLSFFRLGSYIVALIGIDVKKKPGIYQLILDFPKGQSIKKEITVLDRKFPITQLLVTKQLKEKGFTVSGIIQNIAHDNRILQAALKVFTPKVYFDGGFVFPLKKIKVVGAFGNIRKAGKLGFQHLGVDLNTKIGDKVLAVNNGQVKLTASLPNYGKTIVVDHGLGIFSLYLHLNEFKVSKGNFVKKGQIIALAGSTGYSISPHLHFSIKVTGASVDPLRFIKATKKNL